MSNFIAVTRDDETIALFEQVAIALDQTEQTTIIKGTVVDVIENIKSNSSTPDYLLIDLGNDKQGFFEKLDDLASVCESNVKVVVIGEVNELNFYRKIIAKGVTEYFVKPAGANDIIDVFQKPSEAAAPTIDTNGEDSEGKIITFFPSASGDGSTTAAVNTAFCIADKLGDTKKVVLLDLDYQYGLIARNLDITSNFGLREVLEKRQGGLDATLLDKITTRYKEKLDVVSAPNELMFIPEFNQETLDSLFNTLKTSYDYIIVDLPNQWDQLTYQAFLQSHTNIVVSQLSLKSVTHCRRLIDAINETDIMLNKFRILINRSGSKFKEEGITPNMFASTCGIGIDYYISNDSKTISLAENQSRTAVEASNSMIVRQFKELSNNLIEN